jgi:hypothetical protein
MTAVLIPLAQPAINPTLNTISGPAVSANSILGLFFQTALKPDNETITRAGQSCGAM